MSGSSRLHAANGAAFAGGNMSFIIAVQTTRFIVVMLTGPALATFLAKKIDKGPTRD